MSAFGSSVVPGRGDRSKNTLAPGVGKRHRMAHGRAVQGRKPRGVLGLALLEGRQESCFMKAALPFCLCDRGCRMTQDGAPRRCPLEAVPHSCTPT